MSLLESGFMKSMRCDTTMGMPYILDRLDAEPIIMHLQAILRMNSRSVES
jgi:hypothetical protein